MKKNLKLTSLVMTLASCTSLFHAMDMQDTSIQQEEQTTRHMHELVIVSSLTGNHNFTGNQISLNPDEVVALDAEYTPRRGFFEEINHTLNGDLGCNTAYAFNKKMTAQDGLIKINCMATAKRFKLSRDPNDESTTIVSFHGLTDTDVKIGLKLPIRLADNQLGFYHHDFSSLPELNQRNCKAGFWRGQSTIELDGEMGGHLIVYTWQDLPRLHDLIYSAIELSKVGKETNVADIAHQLINLNEIDPIDALDRSSVSMYEDGSYSLNLGMRIKNSIGDMVFLPTIQIFFTDRNYIWEQSHQDDKYTVIIWEHDNLRDIATTIQIRQSFPRFNLSNDLKVQSISMLGQSVSRLGNLQDTLNQLFSYLMANRFMEPKMWEGFNLEQAFTPGMTNAPIRLDNFFRPDDFRSEHESLSTDYEINPDL